MVFQMQVVPGHVNDILWVFDRPRRLHHSLDRVLRTGRYRDDRAGRRRNHVRGRVGQLNGLSSEAEIMSMLETLVAGERGLFKPDTLTPMQR